MNDLQLIKLQEAWERDNEGYCLFSDYLEEYYVEDEPVESQEELDALFEKH